jgi:ABC-2 type transport system permease protein
MAPGPSRHNDRDGSSVRSPSRRSPRRSALYPLWRVQEGSPWLATVCRLNPFKHGVELIRFAFWGKVEPVSPAVVIGCTAVFLAAAIVASDPGRGMLMRRGG